MFTHKRCLLSKGKKLLLWPLNPARTFLLMTLSLLCVIYADAGERSPRPESKFLDWKVMSKLFTSKGQFTAQQFNFDHSQIVYDLKCGSNGCLGLSQKSNSLTELNYELKAQCHPDRIYWERYFEGWQRAHPESLNPFEVKGLVDVSDGDIPRKCVLGIQTLTLKKNQKLNRFVNCSSIGYSGTSGYSPPCLTENYVNLAYNTFTDVMNCLQISQREIFPFFAGRSGLHFNVSEPLHSMAGGQTMDELNIPTGIDLLSEGFEGGQSGIAWIGTNQIYSAKSTFDSLRIKILLGTSKSCQRLRKSVAILPRSRDINPLLTSRCELMASVDGVLTSTLLFATEILRIRSRLESQWNKVSNQMSDGKRRESVLFPKDKASQLQLSESWYWFLAGLSYEGGVGTVSILFKSWIKLISHSHLQRILFDDSVQGIRRFVQFLLLREQDIQNPSLMKSLHAWLEIQDFLSSSFGEGVCSGKY